MVNASFLYHRHGTAVSERTVRGQLRRAGLYREALAAGPKALDTLVPFYHQRYHTPYGA